MVKQDHIINGEVTGPIAGQYIDVIDPVTGDIAGQSAAGDAADVANAVAAAKAAFPGWKSTTTAQRSDTIASMALVLGMHREELIELEARCTGLPVSRLTAVDFAGVALAIQTFAEKLESYDLVDFPPVRALPEAYDIKVVKQPLGVCGLIVPWNCPLFIALNKIIPAVAAGNTVVVKPAEAASLAVVRAIELLQVLFPPGVINVVTGLGSAAGAALVAHPDVAKISFTGSARTGRSVQQVAVETMKRVTLELGGKGPGIALTDAPVELTACGAMYGFLMGAGQICISGTRLFLHDSIHDAVVARMVELAGHLKPGSPFDPATTYGPMVFKEHYQRVLGYIESGLAEGATLACGGARMELEEFPDGLFIQPTIFTDVTPEMKIYQEEIFGPVLCVTRYTDLEEALAMANDTCYGLSAGIWTADPLAAQSIARRIDAGTIWINDWHVLSHDLSFGGVKGSGYGRELGLASMEAYMETRNYITSFETDPAAKPFQALLFGDALNKTEAH